MSDGSPSVAPFAENTVDITCRQGPQPSLFIAVRRRHVNFSHLQRETGLASILPGFLAHLWKRKSYEGQRLREEKCTGRIRWELPITSLPGHFLDDHGNSWWIVYCEDIMYILGCRPTVLKSRLYIVTNILSTSGDWDIVAHDLLWVIWKSKCISLCILPE